LIFFVRNKNRPAQPGQMQNSGKHLFMTREEKEQRRFLKNTNPGRPDLFLDEVFLRAAVKRIIKHDFLPPTMNSYIE
jgi:hypothetical protein